MPRSVSARQRKQANFSAFVMRIRYAIGAVALAYDGSDPNGIRTQFSDFVKLRDFRSNLQESAR